MGKYKYITGDMRELTPEEMESTPLCSGRLDVRRIYRFLYADAPTPLRLQVFSEACHVATQKMNRCERELLISEFGEDRTTLAEKNTVTDVFTESPLDANLKKLDHAVQLIVKAFEEKTEADTDENGGNGESGEKSGARAEAESPHDTYDGYYDPTEEDDSRPGSCLVTAFILGLFVVAVICIIIKLFSAH